jgi:hypothetical protein
LLRLPGSVKDIFVRPVKKGVVVIFSSQTLADLVLGLGSVDLNFEHIDGDQFVNLSPQ